MKQCKNGKIIEEIETYPPQPIYEQICEESDWVYISIPFWWALHSEPLSSYASLAERRIGEYPLIRASDVLPDRISFSFIVEKEKDRPRIL